MKTILVPTDLSPLANTALPVAVSLARQYGAAVRVLHYLPLAIMDPDMSESPLMMAEYLDEQETQANATLNTLCAEYQTDAVPVTPVLCRNGKGLYGAVADEMADLVVLASHGADGWKEWLIGSNAEHFVEAVHCPVLVIKTPLADFTPKKVLFAIEADDRLKTQFSYPFHTDDAHREFLFVTTPNDPRDPAGIRAWMTEFAEAQHLTDYHLMIVPNRNVKDAIIEYASDNAFDLIVLFTNQPKGLRHFINGSVAEDVVNHAPIPVLVIPFS